MHDAGDPVVFGRPPGATVRMCVPAPDPAAPATLRAAVAADVVRRILEDRYGLQVFTTVVRPGVDAPSRERAVLDRVFRALWIPGPAHVARSFSEVRAHLLVEPAKDRGPAPEGVLRIVVGPVVPDGQAPAGEPDLLPTRLAFLAAGLREEIALGPDQLAEAAATLARWRERVAQWGAEASSRMPETVVRKAYAALDDDVGTPVLLGILDRVEADPEIGDGAKFELFVHLDRFLGLDLPRCLGSGHR
ncbi:hypothetical protein DMP23_19645 [Amycolatopsis sp. A1MSW2902]